MSQAFQDPITKEPTRTTYAVEIKDPEELEIAEAYASQNPGARILLDYRTPIINRGAREESYNLDEHVRSLGGATSYEGLSTNGMIEAGRCFEDVQNELLSEALEIIDNQLYLDKKDIFLDAGQGRNDKKVIGFGARMGDRELPNLYGASWQEREYTEEMVDMIEKDLIPVLPEEVEKLSYSIEQETGQNFREHLEQSALSKTPQELLEEIQDGFETNFPSQSHVPTSCVVDWRPEQEYGLKRDKTSTALWPWDIT